MTPATIHTCRECTQPFEPKRERQVFCAKRCSDKFHTRKLRNSGRCMACGANKTNPERFCPSCLETYREDTRLRAEHRRREVIDAYGDRCACCGEREFMFLCIDHVDGGGNKHRATIKGDFYRWLIENNFPPGFQTLCHNCNMAKGLYGHCPHERNN